MFARAVQIGAFAMGSVLEETKLHGNEHQDQPPPAGTDGPLRTRMLGHSRHARILERLAAVGEVTVASLACELAVSDMTVRRDLVELEKDGRLVRVHGGAVLQDAQPRVAMHREEPSFDARLRQRQEAKTAIAASAAELVRHYRTIAIDVGTTTFLMARHLADLQHAKVFTNSVRLAEALSGKAPEVYLPGGRLRADELSIGGPSAVAQFESLWFDAAVVGVSGLTTDGLFDYSLEDAELKRVYLRRAGLKIVVCDSAKFQRMSLVHIAQLNGINVVVTDAEPPRAVAAALAAARVEIRVAPPARTAAP